MEFLKGVLGDELYGQVEEKINAHNTAESDKDKQVKLFNVNSGSYVSKEKYMTLKTKADGLEEQLGTANTEIQSYKDLDIDGIKQKAADWEAKYTADTQALQTKMDEQTYRFAAEKYISNYKFSSDLARKAALNEFMDKKFQLQDEKFLGADDFMKQMKESNKAAFVDEDPAGSGGSKYQAFVKSTAGFKPQQVPDEKAYMDQKYAGNPYYK